MSLAFECPCGHRYSVNEDLAGKVVRCKQCGQTILIPEPETSDPADDLYSLVEGPAAPKAASSRMDPTQADAPDHPATFAEILERFRPIILGVVGVLLGGLMFIGAIRRNPLLQFGPNPAPGPVPTVGAAPGGPDTLVEARRGFKTKLIASGEARDAIEAAPPNLFETIRFPSAIGELGAYLTPDPGDGARHPAIVWITGGDCNSIGDVWTPVDPRNDQTASAFRKAGIVMMFPSLRGGNDNPGQKEGFLGEVDDVLAATDLLAKRPYVDPKRIYLGGHSTGGTLVLLVAESTDRYRSVFSFGPVDDVAGYGPEYLPFDTRNPREVQLRSPIHWLASARCPTFVLEGAAGGNGGSLRAMRSASRNPRLDFHLVAAADHFTILAPTNRLLARKILADDGPTPAITLTDDELNRNFRR